MAKRTDQIQVILSPAEKVEISAHAENIGMSASAFLRTLGLQAVAAAEQQRK